VRSFTAHIRPGRAPVLVAEGTSFWALLFPLPWLLVNGLWIPAALWLALAAAAGALGAVLPAAGLAAALALALGTGVFARDLRRFVLALRGYVLETVVVAPDEDAALARLATVRPDLAARAYAGRA
jgi:hypothetical protein